MKSMTKKQAKLFLESFLNLRVDATDESAITAMHVYPTWEVNVDYVVDDRVLYNRVLYRVLQSHTSQETWTPVDAPSLFAHVLIPDKNVIPEWIQPDSTNPYMTGDKVTCDGKTWESTVDNNVWKPGEYGWNEIVSA